MSPVMEKVAFYNNEILATRDENNQIWVAIKPACTDLGIAPWTGILAKAKARTPIAAHVWGAGPEWTQSHWHAGRKATTGRRAA